MVYDDDAEVPAFRPIDPSPPRRPAKAISDATRQMIIEVHNKFPRLGPEGIRAAIRKRDNRHDIPLEVVSEVLGGLREPSKPTDRGPAGHR